MGSYSLAADGYRDIIIANDNSSSTINDNTQNSSKLNHICRAGLVTVLSKYDPRATVQEAALLPTLSLRQSLLVHGESRDDDVDDEHNDNGDNDNDLLTNVQIPNV